METFWVGPSPKSYVDFRSMSASGKQDGMEMQELTDDDEVRLISNPSSQSTCDINLACAIACSTREGYPAKPVFRARHEQTCCACTGDGVPRFLEASPQFWSWASSPS